MFEMYIIDTVRIISTHARGDQINPQPRTPRIQQSTQSFSTIKVTIKLVLAKMFKE